MLVFRSTPDVSWALLVKRLIDIFGSFFGLLFFALPMLVVAIVVKLTSDGPVIFKQQRAGKYGKPFVMFKFRSMSDDAEMHRAELLPFNQMSGRFSKSIAIRGSRGSGAGCGGRAWMKCRNFLTSSPGT